LRPAGLANSERPVGTAERRSGRCALQKGTVRSLKNCERSMKTLTRMPSNTSMERPPQLVSVFSIRRDLADHLRAVLGPDGAHDMVLRVRSRGRQIFAAPTAAKLKSDGEDLAAPLGAFGTGIMWRVSLHEKLRVVNLCQARSKQARIALVGRVQRSVQGRARSAERKSWRRTSAAPE
jgi:hypothetical protein